MNPVLLGKDRFCEPHQLVFAAVDLEPAVVGERRVEQAQRMREADLTADPDPVTGSRADAGGRPFSDTVHGDNRGTFERRGEERGGRMGLMMLGKNHTLPVGTTELPADFTGNVELLVQPHRHGHAE
jgi:hypothetical protein